MAFRPGGFGFRRAPKVCPDCAGAGTIDGKLCPRCKGGGAVYPPRIQTRHGRTECSGGCGPSKVGGGPKSHHSKEEAQYCDTLRLLVKAGEIKSYRGQTRYDIHDRMGKRCGYLLVDFEVTTKKGLIEIHEYKGAGFMNSPDFKHKRALFTWCYAHIPYHTVGVKDIAH